MESFKRGYIMLEIFKISVSELYKKPFRIVIIFLLNLLVIFGINKFKIVAETFTVFIPLILTIIFIEEYKSKNWKDILINFLIYLGVFSLNTCLLYKRIEILNQDKFITNNKMLFFNLSTTFTDIIVSIFAIGFIYSVVKDLKYKIAVVDMFKYFKEKSSRILVIFYGIIFSLFVFVLIFYGLNSDICYDFLNIFFLFFVIIFICFLILIFKNFLISNKKDEIIYKLREKSLRFYIKYILSIAGLTIGAGIIIYTYIMVASIKDVTLFIIGFITLILIVTLEILILNMFIKINRKVKPKPINFKKFFNVLVVNIIGLFLLGVIIFIGYVIDTNFMFETSLIQHILLAIIINLAGLIMNFQVLGILTDKEFIVSLKDSFILTSKFLNLKILMILIGENIFLTINVVNGTFMGFIYFINFIVSLYLIEFYIKGKESLMCNYCHCIQLWKKFDSPKDYLDCIEYINQLIKKGNFEFIEEKSTCPLNQVKTEKGWVDEIMVHMIKCKHCGQFFTCVVNTYRGSGSFRKGR